MKKLLPFAPFSKTFSFSEKTSGRSDCVKHLFIRRKSNLSADMNTVCMPQRLLCLFIFCILTISLDPYGFPELFCIAYHRVRSSAFSIPEANDIVPHFSHFLISFRTCTPSVLFPFGGISFNLKTMLLGITLTKRIRAGAPSRYKNQRVSKTNILNTIVNKRYSIPVMIVISSSGNNNSFYHSFLND